MLNPQSSKHAISRTALRALLLAAAAATGSATSSAATLYWDGTSTDANANGGAGTWDATTLNWDTLATAGADSAWVEASDASFAGTAGTVTVSGTFALNSLSIASGYTLTGGTLTLGGKTITTSGAGNSADVNINSVLAGTGGITIAANGDTSASGGGVPGSLRLGGTNTFTGGVTITSGVINLDSNFGDAANTITLNGGGLVDESSNTTFARNIIIGASGGVARNWGTTSNYTGGISGTGTLRRTDTGTQNYSGNFTGGVSFNNQQGTTTLRGNWLSTGSAITSGGTLNIRGQVYDGAAIVNTGGTMLFASINRNSVQLSGGTIGLGRAAALGVGATYAIASGTSLGASTGAWLDSSRFAAGFNYTSGSPTAPLLYGSTNLNLTSGITGLQPVYSGTFTTPVAANNSTNTVVTGTDGFFAPLATLSISTGRVDLWAGPLLIGALTGSGNITANGPGRGDTGMTGGFLLPTYNGSVSQNKSVAQVGRLATASIIVGSNNASTTYSGVLQSGSWSGASPSLLKRGTGTLTLTGGSSGMSGGFVVEQGTLVLQTAGSFPGTAYYGTNNAVLRGATLSTNASYALAQTQNLYVLGGTFRYLSGDIYAPNLILDGGTVVNDTGAGGFRFGYNQDAYVNVLAGLGASTFSGRIQLFGNNRTQFFRVADGAAARDLVVSGNWVDDSSWGGLRITKTGLGTMAFTAAATRSGGTTINAGTLEVAAANALGTGTSAGITMGGGTLLVNYASAGTQNTMAYSFGGGTLSLSGNTTAVTQGIGAVTINNGSATISAAPGAGGTTTVNIGNITRSGTATRALLNLTGTATWTTTQANDATTGRLLGVLLNGGFAMNNGSNGIVAYTGTQLSGTTIADGPTTDYTIGSSVTGDLSMAAAGTTTVRSLTLDSGSGRSVNIGAGNTLRVAEGIFQKTSGVALNFGASGTLTAGSANDTAADLLISATGGMASGTGMSVGAVIANNGTGAVTLVKSGVGNLALTGTNTYTGGTIINQGRLNVSGDAVIGGASGGAITVNDGGQLWATGSNSKAITLNGGVGAFENAGYLGAIRLETGVTLSGALTVNNDSQVTTYGSASATISGTVTLNGELVKTGTGTLTLSNGVSGNGTLYVREGTVTFTGDYINKSMDLFVGPGATVSHVGINAFQGNLLTIAGGTYTTSSYHGKFANVSLYGGTIVGTGSGKYAGQDAGFSPADTTLFVGGSTMSRINTPNKIGFNNTRVYVQDVTGNSAPDLLVRGAFDGTGYFAGPGTTRFARQAFATGNNSNHTATTYIQYGHTLEVASDGSMGTGTIIMDGGTLRMTSLAGLAEYQLTGNGSLDSTNAGNLIGVTTDNQQHNSNSSGTFGGNTTWSYRGKLAVTGGSRTIAFAENIDDAAWVRISGTSDAGATVNTVVLNDATWNSTTTGSITLAAGTYNIDVRGWNGGGGYGPVSGLNGNGIAWDINNGTNWTSIGITTDAGVQVFAAGNLSQTLSNSITFSRISDVQVQDATDTVTLSGVIGGAGMLNKTGAGALVLSNSGNTISGGMTVTGGELRIGASGAQGTGSINLLSGSTLTYSGSANATFTNPIIAERGDAAISVSNAAATLTLAQGVDNYTTGAATRTLAKQGSGTLEIAGLLTGNHLYNIQGGTLVISATDASRVSANVAAGTTLSVTASGVFGAVTNAGTATLSSTSIGAISNTAGTLTAASATTLSSVTVTGGTVTANAATAVGNLSATNGTLTLGAATTAGTLGVGTGGTLSASALTTSGAVTVTGGTLNATSLNSTSSGAIAISGGTVNLGAGSSLGATSLSNGTLNIGAATLASINKTGGTLNLGAVGTASTLTATGNSTLGGILNFDLSSSTTSGNDLIAVGGTVNFSSLSQVVFNLTSGVLGTGSYTLVSSTGITNPTVGLAGVIRTGIVSGASRQTYTLSTTTVANALTLDVAGAVGTNTWAATGNNDIWSTNSTDGSWVSTATDQWFYNADLVTFGDLAGVSAKTVTVSGSVAPGSTSFTNTSATTYTLDGTGKITGTTSLTKTGNGRLILGNTGGNDFSGATTVSNGTLEVGNATALSAASAVTVSGGTLDVAAIANAAAGSVTLSSGSIVGTTGSLSATSLTVTGGILDANLSGGGSLTFNGAGATFNYSKTASHTGGTTLSAGTLNLTGNINGALTLANGTTATVASGSTVGGAVTLAGNASLTNAGTLSSTLGLAGSSTATNNGTLTGAFALTGTSTLTSSGALSGGGTVGSGTTLVTSGTLTGNVANSGTVRFDGSTDRTYAGAVTGSGVIQKSGTSVLTLSGLNSAGSVSVLGGTLALSNAAGAVGSSAITLAAGTTLSAPVSQTYSGTLTLSGNAALDVASGVTLTRAGGLAGGRTLTISGSGTTNFQGYGSGAFNSSSLNVTGGTVRFTSGYFNNNIGLASITIGSGTTVVNAAAHGMGGYLTSSPAVTLNAGGTFTLSSEQYLSSLTINGGTINGGNEVRADNGFTVSVNGNATWSAGLNLVQTNYNLTVADGATLTQSGYISNANGVRKSGAGTLVLSGSNSYSNGTVISGGVLESPNAGSALGTGYLAIQNGTYRYTGTGSETTSRALWVDQGTGTFDITSATGSLTFSSTAGALSRAITKNGDGALTLADDISGAAAVTANAGTLTLNGAGSFTGGLALGAATVNLGTATAGGSGSISTSGASTLGVATGVSATHTTLSGAGSLTKSGNGALTLSGANTLAGNLNVSGGSLTISDAAGFGHGGTTTVASGSSLNLGASVVDTQTGLITNQGTLTNAGSSARGVATSGALVNSGTLGAVTLTAGTVTNTGTLGAVAQTDGTLTSTGTIGDLALSGGAARLTGAAGALSVGAGTVNVGGLASTGQLSATSLNLADGAVLDFELSDAGNSLYYDRLTLSGGLDLSALTGSATLRLFSFDRAANARGNATVFNQYSSFAIDLITAASVTGPEVIEDFFGNTVSTLALDTTGFTNAFSGTWGLVRHDGGYRLEYTATLPTFTVDVADAGLFATLGDSTEGAAFLASGDTNQILRKTGPGSLVVTETLGHIGGTQIDGGSLILADSPDNFAGVSLGTGDIAVAAGASLVLGNSGVIANAITGAGNVTKLLETSLEITGNVAISGTLQVAQGTLSANYASMSGTLEILSGATAVFTGGNGLTFSGQLSGAGTAQLASGNTLTIGATNNGFTGTFAVDNGTLVLAANNAIGTGTAQIGALGTVSLSGGVTLASAFSGDGALTKTGAGTATLTGSVAHTGTTTVSAGTLKGDFTNATGAIAVASGATLEYAIASDASRAGANISGAGSLTKSGNGTLTLTSAVALTGGVNVAAGTLAAADFGSASTLNIASGATARLDLASNASLATVVTGSGLFTKTGNSTLTLGSGGLTGFTGKLRVTQGTVATAAAANLGATPASLVADAIQIDGGSLAFTVSGQTLAANRGITVGSAGATLSSASLGQTGTLTVDSQISGTGALTLAGSGNTSASGGGDAGLGIRLTNGSNSFVGDVTITSGLVSYASNAVFGDAANRIILNGGGLLDNNANVTLSRDIVVQSGGGLIRTWGSTTATLSGALSGSGALARTDAGTLNLTGDLSGFTGTLNNQAATTVISGSAAGFGAATVNVTAGTVAFAPARLGSATVNLDGGTLRFDAAGTASTGAVKLVSGKAGYVNTNGYDVTLTGGITGSGVTLQKSGSGTLTLQGAGSATLSSNVNAYAGTLEFAGQSVTSADQSIDGGTLKISSGTNTATNMYIASGTLVITGGVTSVSRLRTSENYAGSNSTINQSGGTFNVTGSTIQNERDNSFMLNHWSGTSTYNLSGGTLNVLNTNANLGWDGNAYINQTGGTANLRGVNMATGRTNAAAYNLTGGRLNIGAGGITSATNKTVTFGNATVGAMANWTGASAMSINAGTTVTVDTLDSVDGATARTITLSGAIGGAGSLTKAGAGTLTLSGANTFSGALTVSGGTLNINNTLRNVSGIAVGDGAAANFNVNNVLTNGHGSPTGNGVVLSATGTGAIVFGNSTDTRIGNVALTNGGSLTSNRGNVNGYDVLIANTSSGAATVAVTGTSATAAQLNGTGGFHLQGVQNFAVDDVVSGSAADLVVSAALYDPNTSGGSAGGLNKTGAGTMTLTNSGNSFSGAITLAGGTLEVTGGGRLNAGNFGGALSVANGTFRLSSTANQTLSGAVANSGALEFASSGNTTVSGAITGTGSLTKSGNGTLTLTGTNTYTGATTVSAGTLVGTTDSLQGNILNNAAVTFDQSTNGTYAGVISGTGSLTKSGSGTVTLTGVSTYTGATTVTAGTLAGTTDTLLGNIANNGTVAFDQSVDGTYAGVISGSGSLAKSGAGALTLTGVNTYTGGTVVSSGALELVAASSYTLSGDITGAGSLTKSGNGTLTLTGANTYSGGTTVSAGALVGNTGSLQGNIANNGTVTFSQSTDGAYTGNITGSGSLIKSGAGTLTLSGSATHTGGTTVAAGTLALSAGLLEGPITNNGTVSFDQFFDGTQAGAISGTGALVKTGDGLLTLTGANTYTGGTTVLGGALVGASDSLQGHIANEAAVIFDQSSDGTYAGNLSGSGSLTKSGAGSLTLAGTNTHTGGTTVLAGTLVGTTGSLQGDIVNDAALVFSQSSAGTHAGAISGAGTLAKLGAGTVTLTGANSFTGGTTISAGTLAFANGSLGSTGLVTVDGGALRWAAGNTEDISSRLSLGSSGATLHTGGNDVTLGTAISADGSLTKVGNGTLTLSASGNSVAGSLNVTGGTLALSALDAVAGGIDIGSAGTVSLSLNLSSDAAFANALSGTGILAVSNAGSGVLSLADASGFSGGTVNLLAGVFDNTGFTGKIGLLGGSLLDFGALNGAVAVGMALTEQQQATLAAFTGTLELVAGATLDISKVNASAELIVGTGATLDLTNATAEQLERPITLSGNATLVGAENLRGTVEVAAGSTVSLGSVNLGSQASLVLSEGATVDFTGASAEQLTRTITLSGTASLAGAESFTGTVALAAGSNVTIAAGALGGGTLEVSAGASVTIAAPIENTVVFAGGAIAGGANLSSLELGSGSLTFGAGGNIDALAPTATLVVSGGTVDFAGTTVAATVEFGGGEVQGGENFSGTLAVQSGATLANTGTLGGTIQAAAGATVANAGTLTGTVAVAGGEIANTGTISGTVAVTSGVLVNNGTVTGDTTVGAGGTLSGNGTFAGALITSGGALNPGSSPGKQTYTEDLVLAGGASWQVQIFSDTAVYASGALAGLRGYDTIEMTSGAGLDLSGASAGNQITLELMTLTNWADNVAGIPTLGNLTFEKATSGPYPWVPKEFALATYTGPAILASGQSLASVFSIDYTGFYYETGPNAATFWAQAPHPWGEPFWLMEKNLGGGQYQLTLMVVPEPSTYGMILGGLALAAAALRRRKARKA